MSTWTAKEKINSYNALFKQNVELPHIWILCMLNLLIAKVFLAITYLIFHLYPECFIMLYLQTLMQLY